MSLLFGWIRLRQSGFRGSRILFTLPREGILRLYIWGRELKSIQCKLYVFGAQVCIGPLHESHLLFYYVREQIWRAIFYVNKCDWIVLMWRYVILTIVVVRRSLLWEVSPWRREAYLWQKDTQVCVEGILAPSSYLCSIMVFRTQKQYEASMMYWCAGLQPGSSHETEFILLSSKSVPGSSIGKAPVSGCGWPRSRSTSFHQLITSLTLRH